LRYPGDERFDVWRARLHLLRDDVGAARDALASARKHKPASTELMLAEGELERIEGNAAAATASYQAAIAATPDSARAWHGLGIVQTEREDVANARVSLDRALALEPQGIGFRAELGTLEAFADQMPAARAAFTQALQERPDDYVALTGLALVELKAGNTEAAIGNLLAASLIEPRYARAQTYLAVAYYQQGRTRDALFALSRARAVDPKDPLPDLYQSVIHNDLLQPGDALATARKALELLPYLKSLNQIANDQKGGANLGSALAAFGLEDWARSYAQDSYTPFWAGSHLFLADRYSGDFNKKSELFQGFLADPTVFGASNRFSTLMVKPGHYGSLGVRYNTSQDFKLSEPTLNLNGYSNAAMPFAYFVEAIRTQTQPDKMAFDAAANTYTVALGAHPTYELGLFVYANAFDANIVLNPSEGVEQRVAGRNDRLDLGAHYRFGPQSQAWLKLGQGTEASSVSQLTKVQTNVGEASNGSEFETRPQQNDIQFRHTVAVESGYELSWGLEAGRMEKTNTLVQENFFHIGVGVVPSDRLTLQDRDHSEDLWISNRIRASERLNLQADLAWQSYRKTRDIAILRDRQPPQTQAFAEYYDQSLFAPRLGATYTLGNGATLRGAWQRWQHPASYSALSPIATSGIPIDDSLVNPGGVLQRARAQLDWELSPTQFFTAFADRRDANNLNSPLDGVLNTRADVSNIDRVRQRTVANLGAPDLLEATPVFSRGTVDSAGLTLNQVLSRTLAGYLGYANSRSENTGTQYAGNAIPYLPQHRATLGLTWAGDQRLLLSAQTVWRSERFADEANLVALGSGWDMTVKLHWESADKRWAADGYASNLLKPDVEKIVGVNLVARF
jgi:tetratricopeptide (TPR) repeat protein